MAIVKRQRIDEWVESESPWLSGSEAKEIGTRFGLEAIEPENPEETIRARFVERLEQKKELRRAIEEKLKSERTQREIGDKFNRLASQWLRETEYISSIKKACMHPAYQRIIGMGPDALPYLLRELESNPDHWFWALEAIAEDDPAQSEDTFDGAARAWLNWGRAKRLI